MRPCAAQALGLASSLTALSLLLAPSAFAGSTAHDTVRVTGRVDVSPTCPVQRPGEDCVDRGVAATVTATQRGRTLQVSSGPAGFTIRLAPGVWRLTADAGMSCEQRRVRIVAGQRHRPIVIACDSGIRAGR